MKKIQTIVTSIAISSVMMIALPTQASAGAKEDMKVTLGEELFHDTSFSLDETMSCATCHALNNAGVDPDGNTHDGGSLGDDGVSIGDRNAPTTMYAKLIPNFHFDATEGLYVGGQFWDGRAGDLKAQAKGPFLNPGEMNMPSAEAVIERVKENKDYIRMFKIIYGGDIFKNTDKAYDALADSIAEFERSKVFVPFNSQFDKYLKGNAELTPQEANGLALFNGKAQCFACHTSEGQKPEFTDYTYDNIGVPVNTKLRIANGVGIDHVDEGLLGNTQVTDEGLKGAFKVSTLRNIAVTGPYMHNGVFKNLATVVHFYNTRDVKSAKNPETRKKWEPAEVDGTKNTAELGNLGLSPADEDDLVAFLKTLTDEKFEHLIP